MRESHGFVALYGDIHNHCGVSYGHGTLDDAMRNAALRLDFASITGHAAWPDMDGEDERIAHIVAFHEEGFARLRAGWDEYRRRIGEFEEERGLILFPGYEIHSSAHGDYTIVGFEHDLPLILADSPRELRRRLEEKVRPLDPPHELPGTLAFPHHIGYRPGARGVDWASFEEYLSPVVEVVSMHGMAESDRTDRPFLHSMGPLQHRGTAAYGLGSGHRFGFIGNTDHHSAHPGSYGHGATGVWARDRSREAIWEAIYARRTWANTGELTRLWVTVDGTAMGGTVAAASEHRLEIDLDALAAIDYVELVDTGRRRTLWGGVAGSLTEGVPKGAGEAIVNLELGWGARGVPHEWEVELTIRGGALLEVLPRFRGQEVVSPLDAAEDAPAIQNASWERTGTDHLRIRCTTWGNSTNTTPSTQGIAMRVDEPASSVIGISVDGAQHNYRVRDLLVGSESENLGPIDSPAFRISAEDPSSYRRTISWSGPALSEDSRWWYVRVRLANGHWALSSPIFFDKE